MSRLFIPREYQGIIQDFQLSVPRNNTFCFMGAGKTVTTLTVWDILSLTVDPFPALVLAPLRVAKDTWATEASKWDHLKHLRVSAIVGTAAERKAALERRAEVYTINYENLPWLMEALGGRWPFRAVAADESTKLKSFRVQQGGSRAGALREVAHTKVKWWTNLTGTPAPRGLDCLWGQNWFVDRGQRLGRSFAAFEHRWFRKGWDGYGLEPFDHSPAQIHEAIADVSVSLNAADWFDIEDPIVLPVYVTLRGKAREIYDEMEEELFAEIEAHEVEAANAAVKTQKCLQITGGAIYKPTLDGKAPTEWLHVHDEKLEALASIFEENTGHSIVVVYQFKHELARILKAFPRAAELKKGSNLADFKKGKLKIGLAHAASLGHGVDGMQNECHRVVFFAHDWNLEYRQQIFERIGPVRQMQAGFKRPVYCWNIIARDTMDEVVLENHEGKDTTQRALMAYVRKKRRG